MNRKLFKEIAINYLCWLIGFTLILYTIMYFEYGDDPAYRMARLYKEIKIFIFMALVLSSSSVLHYYLLYARFFQKGLYGRYVAGILLLLLVTLVADNALALLLSRQLPQNTTLNFLDLLGASIMRNAFFYTPAAIFYTLIKANVALRKRRRQLEQQQLESNIAALKQQLDPHFLFNTLNTIYATAIQEGAGRTAAAIEELSGLFRYSIQEAGSLTVPVEKELAFIDQYLHLQRLRLPETENITINVTVEKDKEPASIAPMLLLPLIENAFKYGISYKETSRVDIHISITNRQLVMEIENTDFSRAHQLQSTGVGLSNVSERLALQYPGRHELRHGNMGDVYHVSLKLNLPE